MSTTVLYAADGPVATVTLNRPERLNAMNRELIGEAIAVLEKAASDPAIRVLILTGAGKGFCAGGDLAGFADGEFKLSCSFFDVQRYRLRCPPSPFATLNNAGPWGFPSKS